MLVTGGLGFIGSNLARRLVQLGAHVTLVDCLLPTHGGNIFNIEGIREQVRWHLVDVRETASLAPFLRGQQILFNLAGQTSHIDSMTAPVLDLQINAAAQLSILEACREQNPDIKVVFASTRQLYGKPAFLPVDESHAVRPVDVNGINKFAGESYHLLYNDVYGIRACALRLTNTFGPRMRVKDARQTFLGLWVRLLLENRPISVFGDGCQVRDFNYVDDCVDALLLAGANDVANGKIYNLGSPEVTSLRRVAELMVEGHGGSFELLPFPPAHKAIDIGDYCGNFSRISRELGWTPKIGLREGLDKTIEFFRENGQHYWDVE